MPQDGHCYTHRRSHTYGPNACDAAELKGRAFTGFYFFVMAKS